MSLLLALQTGGAAGSAVGRVGLSGSAAGKKGAANSVVGRLGVSGSALGGPPKQYARPASDITAGGWVVAPFWSKLNDVIPDDAASQITTSTSSSDTFEVKLSALNDPLTAAGHIIRLRIMDGGTGLETWTAELYQGATLRATFNPSSFGAWLTNTYTLTAGEANSITDYTDLRIRVTLSTVTPTTGAATWIEFETPLAPTRLGSGDGRLGTSSSNTAKKGALESSVGTVGLSSTETGKKGALESAVGKVGLSASEVGTKNAKESAAGRVGLSSSTVGVHGAKESAVGTVGLSSTAQSIHGGLGQSVGRVGVSGQAVGTNAPPAITGTAATGQGSQTSDAQVELRFIAAIVTAQGSQTSDATVVLGFNTTVATAQGSQTTNATLLYENNVAANVTTRQASQTSDAVGDVVNPPTPIEDGFVRRRKVKPVPKQVPVIPFSITGYIQTIQEDQSSTVDVEQGFKTSAKTATFQTTDAVGEVIDVELEQFFAMLTQIAADEDELV